MYREGASGVAKLIRAFEEIGYDEMDMFDHVVMGYPTENRRAPFYTPHMPIMEAMTMLSFAAAITEKIVLGTSVLVLPQRQAILVAKQASSIDTLSAGRLRLGVGLGWQESEYQALYEDFSTRGNRFSEAVRLMRVCWQDEHIIFKGHYYQLEEIAMEPKPPQHGAIPIWIGGTKEPQLKRVAALADGWMAMTAPGDPPLEENLARMREFLYAEDRDPGTFPMQMSLSPDALDREKRKQFYAEPRLILERAMQLKEMGFTHVSIDCVPIFQKGYRSVDAMIDYLYEIYVTLEPELRG